MVDDSNAGAALTADERRCLYQLEEWNLEIQGLLVLLLGNAPLVAHQAEEARERLTKLKDGLGAEARRLAARSSRGELNEAERASYDPAIQQTSDDLTISAYSAPGPAWYEELSYVQETIALAIFQLKSRKR